MDSYDRTDLLLCTEGLGQQARLETEDGSESVSVYQLGPDSLGCLQDIQRFLRRDDLETKSFHLQLGSWNLISAHLLPMLTTYRENFEIVYEILKLLVMLTMPPDQKLRDPTEYKKRLSLYKEAFVNRDIISIIVGIAATPISHIGMERTHQDIQLLELILTLLRNLLSITPAKPNVTDEIILTLDKEHVFELMLHLASQAEAPENARFNHLILEFFYLAFVSHDAQTIASTPDFDLESASPALTTGPKPAESSLLSSSGFSIPNSDSPSKPVSLQSHMSSKGAALAAALQASKPTAKTSSPSGGRHSRFGGYVTSTPTITANVQLSNFVNVPSEEPKRKKPLVGVEFTSSSSNKPSTLMSITDVLSPKIKRLKASRSTVSVADPSVSQTRESSIVTKLILKILARKILDHCFNELFGVLKGLVVSHSPLVDSDLDHYVWALGFFPSFLSCDFRIQKQISKENASNSSLLLDPPLEFNIGSVQSIFEESTFYYILEQLERYETEKNAAKVAIHFLALKNLIFTLFALFDSGLDDHMRISESIVMKLIYNPELLVDRLPRLVRTFTKMKKGSAYLLPHLIECVHLFLSVLERISEHGLRKLVQLKKRSKATFGSKIVGDDEERAAPKLTDEEAALLVDDPDQLLSSTQNDDSQGPTSSKDDDYARRAKELKELLESLQDDEDDEDAAQNEKYFDVNDYIAFYSKQSIVNALVELLKYYDINPDQTNEAVLGMFKRIESLGGLPMFFQLSYLRVFAEVLTSTPKSKLAQPAVDLRRFVRKMTGKFLEHFEADPVTFGLTSLWPKKLSYARDLNEGLYLTIDSYHDGTLEQYEQRYYSRSQELDSGESHSVNPSRVGTSYNQRARPYLGEGLQGNTDFDLADLLTKPDSMSSNYKRPAPNNVKSKAERLETRWKELRSQPQRQWTEAEEAKLKSLYSSYSELDESDVVSLVISMLEIDPAPTAADVYLKLESFLDAVEFSKLKRPELDIGPDLELTDNRIDAFVPMEGVRSVDKPRKPKLKKVVEADAKRPKAAFSEKKPPSNIDENDESVGVYIPKAQFDDGETLDDSSSNSDSDDHVGFAQQLNRGKTAKQIRDEMNRRKLELQMLEEKKRAENALLVAKRREERAEQRKLNEAASLEAKKKRKLEREQAKIAKDEEKAKARLATKEAKALERQSKMSEKDKEKEAKRLERQGKRESVKGGIIKRATRKPHADAIGDGNGSDITQPKDQGEESTPVATSRPKRAAAGRKRASEYEIDLDALGASDDEDTKGTPKKAIKKSKKSTESNEDDNAMDVDQPASSAVDDSNEDGAEIGTKKTPGKGKRRRPVKDDDDDFAASGSDDDIPVAVDSDDGEEYQTQSKKKAKRSGNAKSKKTSTPAKKKAKLTSASSLTDSAPLESSLFTTDEVVGEGRINRTSTTITTAKRKLIRNADPDGTEPALDQSLQEEDEVLL